MPIDDGQIVRIARALADPTRLRILRAIPARGACACADLHAAAGVAKATLSHHLKILREAGLITVRREGQFHQLTANAPALRAFASAASKAAPRPRGRRSK
jgi:ArsR family transcriptional regulator